MADYLSESIKDGSHLSFVSAYFTIYAYAKMKDQLDRIGHLRFLFGELRFVQSLDPNKTDKKAFNIEDRQLQLETAHGAKMGAYDDLLRKAIAAIARSFQKRVATGMQQGRDFVIPSQQEQVRGEDDFELITRVVIRRGGEA